MIIPMTGVLTDWLAPIFMQKALFALLLLAPAAAMIGIHVVGMRMSYYTNAISHSTFTGIALGLLLGIDPRWSTLLFGMVVAVSVLILVRKAQLHQDTLVGVLFSGVVAIGIVLVSATRNVTEGFEAALYGDVLSIETLDLLTLGTVLTLTIIFEIIGFNKIMLSTVNDKMARAHGINTKFWEVATTLWVAVIVLVGLRIVGLLMITALLVVPAAAGRNIARSITGALGWSLIFAAISSIVGLAASYWMNSATGATVILVSVIIFILTLPFSSK